MNEIPVIELLVNLICSGESDKGTLAQISEIVKEFASDSVLDLLEQLTARNEELDEGQVAADATFTLLVEKGYELDDSVREAIAQLYRQIKPTNNLRNNLLNWLGTEGSEESLRTWCELVVSSPPANPHGLIKTFSPLINQTNLPAWLFEALATQGIAHPEIAAASLDLMNYHHRSGNLEVHPALPRAQQLTSLLGSVVQQMARVEEGQLPPELTPQEISIRVSESVALTISLCDALALMRHEPAVGKMRQALELRHRRIQTEAAAALARLDVEEGRQGLAKLAEEPIARMRVLAYAEELGILDQIPDEHQTEIATAESKLAMWLSDPAQMGLAPSEMELIDNRELYWPSFEHPVQCFLFRFRYGSDPTYTNLGISGPLTHVFSNNIESLTVDDAYAAFAGWQAVHPKIFQMSPQRAQEVYPDQLQELTQRLEEKGLDQPEPVLVGSFFDELVLVTQAVRNQEPIIALADESDVFCFTGQSESDRIDAGMAYTIWRGRKLLSQFNE